MFAENAAVKDITELKKNIFLLRAHSPKTAKIITPGQFCNIKVSANDFPLLRRPFSICDVEEEDIFFLFNVHGEGTKLLSQSKVGSLINLLTPLGNGFNTGGDFDNLIIVAGGLGVAPFPYLTRLENRSKNILSFIGGKTENDIITYGLQNCYIATEDGSLGFKGNVIELLNENKSLIDRNNSKVFGCGPNPMLKALKEFCIEHEIYCEISVECAMACGFGICQGCPIESDKSKYLLVCKDGPIFNVKDVVL